MCRVKYSIFVHTIYNLRRNVQPVCVFFSATCCLLSDLNKTNKIGDRSRKNSHFRWLITSSSLRRQPKKRSRKRTTHPSNPNGVYYRLYLINVDYVRHIEFIVMNNEYLRGSHASNEEHVCASARIVRRVLLVLLIFFFLFVLASFSCAVPCSRLANKTGYTSYTNPCYSINIRASPFFRIYSLSLSLIRALDRDIRYKRQAHSHMRRPYSHHVSSGWITVN